MSIITPSDTALAYLSQLTIGQQRFDLSEMSDSTGHTATRLGGPPRWTAALRTLDAMEPAVSALWKSVALQMRGRINHLALYDVTQPAPRGTARGSMTLNSTAAAGASSIAIAGVAVASTLLEGDWLQIGTGVGSHLCLVVADATANGSGVITVSVEPPTRKSFASATAVAWDKPRGFYKQRPDSLAWSGAAGSNTVGGFAFDLMEDWTA